MVNKAAASDARVFVVDDDDQYRESLRKLLSCAGWQVEAFASADAFLKVIDDLPGGTLLLDVRMPGTGGLELLSERPEQLDRFTVIVVTGHGDVDVAVRSLKLGAIDFLEKPFDPKVLLDMLQATAGTGQLRCEAAARQRGAQSRTDGLSPRELEVLCGMLAGGSNKVIARRLGISDRTVEMHRARMLDKLGAGTSSEAVQLATLAGLKPAW